jgi:decaprenylphospho-beta-D-ribofuranose 2-oxidase
MPPAEGAGGASPAGRAAAHAELAGAPVRSLSGWGRVAWSSARVLQARDGAQLEALLSGDRALPGGIIARGAGRSYGDPAQNGGGAVLDMRGLRWIAELDCERRTVRAGAGTTLAELLALLVPRGLMLPVTPGTQLITVGGAIAADVHGKNHPRDGSFGAQVRSFVLCLPGGRTVSVSRSSEPELFAATLGGMGLTGVLLEATLALESLPSPLLRADIDRVGDIDAALGLLAEDGEGGGAHRFGIAWLDLLGGRHSGPGGGRWGRGVVVRSDYARAGEYGAMRGGSGPMRASGALRTSPAISVPRGFPGGAVRPATVRAFNELRWRRSPRAAREQPMRINPHFFPLDALGEWSRLYGRSGLVQYQFAVPHGAERTLVRVAEDLGRARLPMYLVVLKRLGAGSGGLLSFPRPGFTLAIDIPAGAPGLRPALARADELVAAAGGCVYLAKDSLLHPEALAAMYPELERFRALRARIDPEGLLASDLGRRLAHCPAPPRAQGARAGAARAVAA